MLQWAYRWLRAFKGAGLVIGPTLLILDIALNISDVLSFGLPTWIIASVGIVLFVGSGLAILKGQQAEIDTLQAEVDRLGQKHPTIKARTITETGGKMYLEVENLGEQGAFQAQIEVLEGDNFIHGIVRPPLPAYSGYWQRSAGSVANLPQGHKDRVMIGELSMTSSVWSASFEMYFFSNQQGQPSSFGTTSWNPGSDQFVPARFLLRITISSAPKLKEGAFKGLYIIEGNSSDIFREAGEEESAD